MVAASAKITTPFSAESTATEVVAGLNLSGQRIVVTGGASGIGRETVRALAGAGASVTIATRNLAVAEDVAREITTATGNKVETAALDLTDLKSVKTFAEEWTGPLHVLINNAGILMMAETRTPQGWELHFATNHLGHAALAIALHDALAEAGGARIVSVSAVSNILSDILWDDIHFERHPYNPLTAYAQSKTANALFAVGATQRWSSDGITANAVHPGIIPGTGLQRYVVRPEVAKGQPSAPPPPRPAVAIKTPEQGAATSVLVATSSLLAGVGGRYFEDCQEAKLNEPGKLSGYAPWALDPDSAERLWLITEAHLASAT